MDGQMVHRAALSRFAASGGGGVTAFKMSEPRRRHRLQDAIGTGDHATEVDTRGADPGRYDPSVGAIGTWDPCRARAVGVFIPSEGPGDAYARVKRERVKSGMLLDTAPQTDYRQRRRRAFPLGDPSVPHMGFGTREKRFGAHLRPAVGPAPGSYDLFSSFDRSKPALGRALAVPLTRGVDRTWVPARPLVSARAATADNPPSTATSALSVSPRSNASYYSVTSANAQLKE